MSRQFPFGASFVSPFTQFTCERSSKRINKIGFYLPKLSKKMAQCIYGLIPLNQ